MRYNRMVSGVLAVAILTAMVGTVVSTTTVPSASATVDPTLCSGNSARISVFPFLLKSCADSDEVWIQSQIHAPITYSYSGDLSSPVIQPSTDDSTNAFRTLINPPTSLLPSEGLTLSAGPGAGSVTLTPPSQSLIFEWAFAKAIAPLVPDPAEQLIIDGAGVIQRATTCISAGGSKTRCYVSALATSLSSIHNDLKDFMDLAGKTLLAVQKYIVQVFTGQFAFQSYLDTVKADDKLNFDNDTLTINPLLQITTDSLPSGTQGTLYDQILQATGGATGDTPTTYTWKVTSGSLPLGLSLDRSTGEITGTPTSAGTSTFQVTVKDDTDKQTATADLTIDVSGGIVQSAPGSGTTSSASSTSFTDQLNTTGQVGPVTFVTMTSVPGIAVSSSGAISVTSQLGVGSYTVSGTDKDNSGGTGIWTYTLQVTANTLSCGGAGTVTQSGTFTGSYSGTWSVSFIQDGAGNITSGTLTINVTGVDSISENLAGATCLSWPASSGAYTVNAETLTQTGTDTWSIATSGTWVLDPGVDGTYSGSGTLTG